MAAQAAVELKDNTYQECKKNPSVLEGDNHEQTEHVVKPLNQQENTPS